MKVPFNRVFISKAKKVHEPTDMIDYAGVSEHFVLMKATICIICVVKLSVSYPGTFEGV